MAVYDGSHTRESSWSPHLAVSISLALLDWHLIPTTRILYLLYSEGPYRAVGPYSVQSSAALCRSLQGRRCK